MILECPVRLTDTSFTRKYIDTFLNFNSVMGSNTKDVLKYKWPYKENNVSRFYNRNKLYQKNEEYEIDNECMPRYQLVRVKHAETFSIVYLLQVIFAKIRTHNNENYKILVRVHVSTIFFTDFFFNQFEIIIIFSMT